MMVAESAGEEESKLGCPCPYVIARKIKLFMGIPFARLVIEKHGEQLMIELTVKEKADMMQRVSLN